MIDSFPKNIAASSFCNDRKLSFKLPSILSDIVGSTSEEGRHHAWFTEPDKLVFLDEFKRFSGGTVHILTSATWYISSSKCQTTSCIIQWEGNFSSCLSLLALCTLGN